MIIEYVNIAEARTLLAISKAKMSALIANGVLLTYPNALDARSKLVKITDVKALKTNGSVSRKRTKKERPQVTARDHRLAE